MTYKKVIIVCMMLAIAALHFITGKNYGGPYPGFVNGYLIDLVLPFGIYFLLCLFDSKILRPWAVKSIAVLGIAFAAEIAQYFGLPLFGRTYDPIDFVRYVTGIILAVSFDEMVFPWVFTFWKPGTIN